MAGITPSRRLRPTPFTSRVEAAGVKGYTIYNHMLLPTQFTTLQEDCEHLKTAVQIWDVSVERQVSVRGADAEKLMRWVSPRDIGKMADDQCYYAPICDAMGGMLNDPVILRLAKDHFWISLADGDLLQYLLGLAIGAGLNVDIVEPDVSPLAVQGPKADQLMERVFGPIVHDIKFFRYKRLSFKDTQFIVARSGWSKQGGYEIYVEGSQYGPAIWDALFEAGHDLNVRAGCPNLIERIEGGLLTYGSDITRENTPLEAGLGRFCNSPDDYIGKSIIEAQKENGPERQIRAVTVSGDDELPPIGLGWPLSHKGEFAGLLTSVVYSPYVKSVIGVAMIERKYWSTGQILDVDTHAGMRRATIQEKFWK